MVFQVVAGFDFRPRLPVVFTSGVFFNPKGLVYCEYQSVLLGFMQKEDIDKFVSSRLIKAEEKVASMGQS